MQRDVRWPGGKEAVEQEKAGACARWEDGDGAEGHGPPPVVREDVCILKTVCLVELDHDAHLELEGDELRVEGLLASAHAEKVESENLIALVNEMREDLRQKFVNRPGVSPWCETHLSVHVRPARISVHQDNLAHRRLCWSLVHYTHSTAAHLIEFPLHRPYIVELLLCGTIGFATLKVVPAESECAVELRGRRLISPFPPSFTSFD